MASVSNQNLILWLFWRSRQISGVPACSDEKDDEKWGNTRHRPRLFICFPHTRGHRVAISHMVLPQYCVGAWSSPGSCKASAPRFLLAVLGNTSMPSFCLGERVHSSKKQNQKLTSSVLLSKQSGNIWRWRMTSQDRQMTFLRRRSCDSMDSGVFICR